MQWYTDHDPFQDNNPGALFNSLNQPQLPLPTPSPSSTFLNTCSALSSRQETTQTTIMACTFACASFFSKALFCQNKDHFDIPTTIPTIGVDPIVDTCLCQQSNIEALHSCASCRAKNNITYGDGTWVFIDACNRQFPERRLWLPSAAGPGLRPWGFSKRTSTKRRLVDAMNVYSVLLVVSFAVSTCSFVLAM